MSQGPTNCSCLLCLVMPSYNTTHKQIPQHIHLNLRLFFSHTTYQSILMMFLRLYLQWKFQCLSHSIQAEMFIWLRNMTLPSRLCLHCLLANILLKRYKNSVIGVKLLFKICQLYSYNLASKKLQCWIHNFQYTKRSFYEGFMMLKHYLEISLPEFWP